MGKLIKKTKPTKAEYFKSESQRKRSSRLAFIYGSKQLVAVLSILVIGSALAGIAIVQKQKDSKAATVENSGQAVSFNKADAPVSMAKWSRVPDQFTDYAAANDTITLGFKQGAQGRFEYGNGYRTCVALTVEASAAHPKLVYTNAQFTYKTNEAGTNAAKVYVGGQEVPSSESPAGHQSGAQFDKSLTVNFQALNGRGIDPGTQVQFCNVKTGGNTAYFGAARSITLYAYSFRGTYSTFTTTPDPVATPAAPAPAGPKTPTNPVIDSNRWSGWGFPLPSNPATNHTIEHDNNGKLTINYLTYNYTNNVTGCWTNVINSGNTATDFVVTLTSNDSGRNVVFLKATGNPDYQVPKATNGKITWNLTTPVGNGGSISVCSKVVNTDNKAFAEKRSLSVTNYQIHGTGTANNDTTPPTVTVTSPKSSESVKGTITLSATATDASGIEYVEFKNEANSGILSRMTAEPYNFRLDTTKLAEGNFTISAVARDKKGNFKTSTPVTFKVQNKVATPAPTTPTTPKPSTPSNPSSPTTPKPSTPTAPASPTSCEAVRVAEAENGVRSGSTTAAQDPKNTTVTATALFGGNAYVECRLKAAETGTYSFGAKVRSDDFKGIPAEAKISTRGAGNEADRTVSAPAGQTYGVIRYNQTADYRKLNQGQSIIVRITFTNDDGFGNGGDRNLWVDQIAMYKIPEPSTPAETPSTPTTPSTPAKPQPPAKNTKCESGVITEAELGVTGGATAVINSDPLSQETGAMLLASNNSYVECTLTAAKDARYAFGAKLRSQDYKGIAEAKLELKGAGSAASRTVSAPKNQQYGIVRFNEVADYRNLKNGQKVTVRVTFTNDAGFTSTNDRNLWVDNLMLIEIPTTAAAPSNGGNTPRPSTPTTPNTPDAIVPCEQLGQVEAEEGILAGGATIQTDNSASGKKAVRLSRNTNYVECTLKAPSDGKYGLSAIARSDNRVAQDKAIARLTMSGNNKGVQTDTSTTTNEYNRIRMKGNDTTTRQMTANELVVVRVGITNASSNLATKRNLLVDSIELVKFPNTQAPTTPPTSPVNPQNENFIVPSVEAEDGAEQIGYSTNTGALIVTVQAEKAGYKGVEIDENPNTTGVSEGNKAVKLFSNKNYVEYTLNFPTTDMYSLDFYARSEDHKKVPANARIILDGKKVFGNDVKLKSSPRYNYYASEKKVQITKGKHTFKVEFTNDKSGSGEDRNLIIDYLRIRGTKRLTPAIAPVQPPTPAEEPNVTPVIDSFPPTTQLIEAENANNCKATGKTIDCNKLAVNDGLAYGSQALVLNKKGDFAEAEFTTQEAGTYAIGATIRSVDYQGSAKADIYIDGSKVASNIVASSEGYTPARMYAKKFKANTTHKVKVVFLNDQCGRNAATCRPNLDRNLLVDHFRLRPISVDTAPAASATELNTQVGGDSSNQPVWARSTKNNVLATEWACSPPPKSEIGLFYCPADSNKPVNQRKEGVLLMSYPANGGRTSQALVYIPKAMIAELKANKAITPRPLVFYLHGRGNAEFADANRDKISPLGVNRPASVSTGYWLENERDNRLEAAYNTANDPKYGGVILIAPLGQGRVIDERSWGYPPNIADFAKLPTLLEESFSYMKIDRSRIYTMGSSMGGHDSLKFVTQYPSLISAAYSNDGVSDWALRYRQVANKPIQPAALANRPHAISDLLLTIPIETGGTPEQNPQAYLERSPLQLLNADNAKRPIKIAVDYGDEVVDPSQSDIFWYKYKSLNPNAPDRDSSPSGHSSQLPGGGGPSRTYVNAMKFFHNNGNWLRK